MRDRGRNGFTLIEMIAVVLVVAFFMTMVGPQLGLVQHRALQDQATELVADLEAARERAVVTGVTHRMRMNLDTGNYHLEWNVPVAADEEEEEATEPERELRLDETIKPKMKPPTLSQANYEPIPGSLGRGDSLADQLFFDHVETPEGYVSDGEVMIQFEGDGSATPSQIFLVNEAGQQLMLEVRTLAGQIETYDVE